MYRNLNTIARALVALIFVVSGIGKVANFQAMTAMAGSALPAPAVAIGFAALVEIVGGLALLAGWKEQWASLALFVFLIPTTLIFHAANLGNPAQFQMQLVEVLKNMAIMGGLLKFYVDAAAPARAEILSTPFERSGELRRRAS